jgi:hypothetical protein
VIGVAVRGAERVMGRLAQAASDMHAETDRAMRLATLVVRRRLGLELTGAEARDGFWGRVGAPGNKLSARSGKTRASLTPGTRVYRTGNLLVGVVGSGEKHLRLHEDGGTISGTSPKGYLRIPTAEAQTPGGSDRYTGRSIKDIPGAFLIRSATGKLWAVTEAGGRSRRATVGGLVGKAGRHFNFLYLLVKRVTVKPRRIFARVRDESRPQVLELTQGRVTAMVRKANA